MSLKTAITLLVFAAIVPAARGDVDVNTYTHAMLFTQPLEKPKDSLRYSNGWDVSVAYWDTYHPTTSNILQAGVAFNLNQLGFDDSQIKAYRLVLTTTSYYNPPEYYRWPITAAVTYGATNTPLFTVSDFFRSSPLPAVSGTVGVATIQPHAPMNLTLSFDVTSILRDARSQATHYPYLKFWIHAPSQGSWTFVPTLRLVGVPEPSTIVLLGVGLSSVGLVGLRSKRKRRDQAG